jgi:hypothetical protein
MEHMISDPRMGTLVVASAGADAHAQQVISQRDRTDKGVLSLWTGSRNAKPGLAQLKHARIPIFSRRTNWVDAEGHDRVGILFGGVEEPRRRVEPEEARRLALGRLPADWDRIHPVDIDAVAVSLFGRPYHSGGRSTPHCTT